MHAASVLHMSQMLVNGDDGLRDRGIVEDILEFSLYMAAICHDYKHPGLTNAFLINSHHPLAMCYNDKSPLENYHASAAFGIMAQHITAKVRQMLMHAD